MTVLDLIKKYLSQKTGVQHNTEANHNFVLNIIKKEDFGRQRIDRVKLSDAKCWLIKLQQFQHGKERYEPQDAAIPHGPFRYWRHAEHLYPIGLCGCAGGAGTGRQRRVVKRDKPP